MSYMRRSFTSCCLLFLVTACSDQDATPTVEFRIPVEVTDVTTGDVEDLIVTTGTLRTRESVILTVETPGFLILAKDENGDRLAEGSNVVTEQVIAEITGEDARLASRLEATERHLESAQQELDRRQQLFKQRLIAEEDVWRARTQYEDRLHDYETSQRTFEKTRIVTPIAGVILELARDSSGQAVADGQMVNQGFGVARVAPLHSLIADIDLVGPDLSRVTPGQEVRINHYAFEDRSIDGTILRLSPSMDAQTHTFRVEVEVDNKEGLLRPGMFISASIVAERREDVVVVPREAITQRGGRNVIFVIDGQRVVQRKVGIGLSDDTRFEVSEGLQSGERIAIRGLETLTDGTRVRVITP
ncbi:MAG TPA: efflux RND transporter periplasmic adaptor subunit [Arenicellales bacterium]|nr:efflux RND transporter periplasmic adaptor subunit [Pseudomonadales bacterium]MDP6314688.1 efflux RND transporter periplasmic adaptor subunit [Pseudomonadales bacterium]MDP7313251.1 efflux RND transporter periplasmic adaptor subunit [Pseudomonadales bacterium]HJL53317.1 efflux RND transporter periplasmic adaptor subunit [Arenicellales bacterium]HJP51209.1 efflux RND transporter periplasmic adaptor subunit [Pseudomonadales bacterium]|tara:strand:- start:2169 stop:3245 length:1077 start_codon:yes stop_codon:yes gene_type:complete